MERFLCLHLRRLFLGCFLARLGTFVTFSRKSDEAVSTHLRFFCLSSYEGFQCPSSSLTLYLKCNKNILQIQKSRTKLDEVSAVSAAPALPLVALYS